MPLTFAQRKRRMPLGAQQRVAKACDVPQSFVSAAMRDEVRARTEPTRVKLIRVQKALAAELGRPVDEVFAPPPPATRVQGQSRVPTRRLAKAS